MADTPYSRFFLEPSGAPQRQYEALRAVFAAGCRQKDVAERFGYSYAAFRQLVAQFRAACDAGQPPPFLARRARADRRGQAALHRHDPNTPRRPIVAPLAWRPGDACGLGSLVCSSS
jgi:hypothetical protein